MTNKKLLLVNPPFPRKVAGVPLQMLYLAAAVKDADAEVQLLDLDIERDEQRESILEQKLRDYKPTHVGVTAYSPNYPESLDIMRNVKRVNSSITVISGGPHQIVMGGIAPKPEFIDHIVTATFGEYPLLELLNLERRTVDRTTLFPAFELLKDSPQYQFDSELFGNKKMTQILTATGCNMGCTFCSSQQEYNPFGNQVVIRQLEKIVDLGYRAIFFNDPNFTNPFTNPDESNAKDIPRQYDRVSKLMQDMISANVNKELIWGCQTRADLVLPDVLDSMKLAGCNYITYALESTDQASLQEQHKPITPKKIERALAWSKERGIKTGLYVMFGAKLDPELDFKIAQETLDFVEYLKPNYLSISILANYPMIDRTEYKKWAKTDRSTPAPRKNMHLDYANQKYSREPIWLNFDEGWGAFHPNTSIEQAQRYLKELERRKALKPDIWDYSRPGAIRRF